MRLAIITAARGIGRRRAEHFAAADYSLALMDLRSCDWTLLSFRSQGAEAEQFIGDISDECGVAGTVDAGISSISPAETVEVKSFRLVLEVNLVATFLHAKSFGAIMLDQRAGSIVNVASIAGLMGIARSRGVQRIEAWSDWTNAYACGGMGGRGIRCDAVCPGWVKTEMDVADQATAACTDDDIIGRNPMGRYATPDDIACAILFLADPEQSGFINGQVLPVDGGWTIDGSWQSLRMRHRQAPVSAVSPAHHVPALRPQLPHFALSASLAISQLRNSLPPHPFCSRGRAFSTNLHLLHTVSLFGAKRSC